MYSLHSLYNNTRVTCSSALSGHPSSSFPSVFVFFWLGGGSFSSCFFPLGSQLPGGLLRGLLGPPLWRRRSPTRPGAQRRDGSHGSAPGATGGAARGVAAGGDRPRGPQRGVTVGDGLRMGRVESLWAICFSDEPT